MSSKPKVLMIVTLDTKAVEARFIRDILESEGVDVVHLDASIRESTDPNVEIPRRPLPERPARPSSRFATWAMKASARRS